MTKKKKNINNKAKLSLKRRVALYYSRLIFIIKIIIIIFICLFFFTSFLGDTKKQLKQSFYNFTAQQGFILNKIMIYGNKNIAADEIVETIGYKSRSPILAIDLEEARKKIEDKPWVKSVTIERRLPTTLAITIIEREAIAIWQFQKKLYLIDEEGNRITHKQIDKYANLPHIVGEDANIYAKNLIDDLNKYPDIAKRINSAVRYGQRRWNLNLEQNITIKMPENNFIEAYDYLANLHKQNKLFGNNYKYLDLRDPQKYYIATLKE